ncbi:MAG: hypothetical protein WAP23_01385 [Candidatus Spechtbacterales bacterium]
MKKELFLLILAPLFFLFIGGGALDATVEPTVEPREPQVSPSGWPECDELTAKFDALNSAFLQQRRFLNDLSDQLRGMDAHPEAREAIVEVQFQFQGTAVDLEYFFGEEVPPFVPRDEIISKHWGTIGTAVDLGAFGKKIVVARHAFYYGQTDPKPGFKEALTVSVVDLRNGDTRETPTSGLGEFPELDLVILDIPPALSLPTLAMAAEPPNFNATQISSHLYFGFDGTNSRVYEEAVFISEINSGDMRRIALAENLLLKNYIFVRNRVVPGDSGSPLIVPGDSGDGMKVLGFILLRDKTSGNGIAIGSWALLGKLSELYQSGYP